MARKLDDLDRTMARIHKDLDVITWMLVAQPVLLMIILAIL